MEVSGLKKSPFNPLPTGAFHTKASETASLEIAAAAAAHKILPFLTACGAACCVNTRDTKRPVRATAMPSAQGLRSPKIQKVLYTETTSLRSVFSRKTLKYTGNYYRQESMTVTTVSLELLLDRQEGTRPAEAGLGEAAVATGHSACTGNKTSRTVRNTYWKKTQLM